MVSCDERCQSLHAAEPTRCAYARLFEAAAARESSGPLAGMTAPALVLSPPSPSAPRQLAPGDALAFGVVLPFQAVSDLEPLVTGLRVAARQGLTTPNAPLELAAIDDGHGPLWRDGSFLRAAQPDPLPPPIGDEVVTVRTSTPLRLLRKGTLVRSPQWSDLVRAAVRRLAWLTAHSGGDVSGIHVEEIGSSAQADILQAEWKPFRTRRFSSSQGRQHPMRGIVGTATYRLTDGALANVVRVAAKAGIGKGPAFGFGRLEIRSEAAAHAQTAPRSEAVPGETGG